MSGLLVLDEVFAAHGGLERRRAVTALTVHGTFGGLLRSCFPGNRMANVAVRVRPAELHAVFQGFPEEDQRAVFDRGDVRIETRDVGFVRAPAAGRWCDAHGRFSLPVFADCMEWLGDVGLADRSRLDPLGNSYDFVPVAALIRSGRAERRLRFAVPAATRGCDSGNPVG